MILKKKVASGPKYWIWHALLLLGIWQEEGNAKENMTVMDAATELHGEGTLRTSAPSSFQRTDFACPLHARQAPCWGPGTQRQIGPGDLFHICKISQRQPGEMTKPL